MLADFAVFLTDDAIAKLYLCDVKFRQIDGKFRHLELCNGVLWKF